MKILLAVYLFFLFVFVHGMDQKKNKIEKYIQKPNSTDEERCTPYPVRSGALVGTWKCVDNSLFTSATKSQDVARNLKKPFAFFNKDGTGNWCVDVPDRAKIDSRFKFTVFVHPGGVEYNLYKIRWENDKNESGTRIVISKGDYLDVKEGNWLQKLNIDGSALVGTWKCVGFADEARCIGKFVFFNKDGSGFWNVESPDRGKIDLSFKYFVDQRDDTHFKIYWYNERADGTIYAVLINDKLFVCPSTQDGSNKLWLQKLNKKQENEGEKSEKKSLFSCCCPGKKETITYKKK